MIQLVTKLSDNISKTYLINENKEEVELQSLTEETIYNIIYQDLKDYASSSRTQDFPDSQKLAKALSWEGFSPSPEFVCKMCKDMLTAPEIGFLSFGVLRELNPTCYREAINLAQQKKLKRNDSSHVNNNDVIEELELMIKNQNNRKKSGR